MAALDFADAVVSGSPRRFPNPRLVAHDGRRLRFYDDLVRGRLVLVSFLYTECKGSCPASLRTLLATRRLAAARLGGEPDLVTLTLDPERDGAAALARYVAGHGAPPGSTCLTGAPDDLDRVRRFLGFYDPDPQVDADRSQHGALVAMGDDRSGRWRVASTQASPAELAKLVLRLEGMTL